MIRKLAIVFVLASLIPFSALAVEPIRVGTTQSLSGVFEDFGLNQLRGIQMWVRDINSRGSLLGRPVELVFYDDGSDADRSAELYQKLITEDEVDVLLGPYSSDITIAASQVAQQNNMPMLTLGASAEEIWEQGYDNIVGLDTPSNRYMDLAIVAAAEQGAQTMSLVWANTEFGRQVVEGVRLTADELGIQIVLDKSADDVAEIPKMVDQLKAADADVIMAIAYLEGSVDLVRELKREGVKPKMLVFGVGASLAEFGQELLADAEGISGVVQWLRGVRVPGAQDFAYRFRQLYGHNPAAYAALGYGGGEVIEAAVRLAGTTEPAAVREQLHSMVFNSLLGIYRVDENGRQIGKNNYLLQWQGKDRRLVGPSNIAESQLVYPMP
ncbi:MAG: amino acid ABC transporter substrate-binding protein [Pseudomonadota bacterium]